jgi:hypothetical protein
LDDGGLTVVFTCPRPECREQYTFANGQMIALFVMAVAANETEIRLTPQGTRKRL